MQRKISQKNLTLFEEAQWPTMNIARARKGRGQISINQSFALTVMLL